MTDAEAPGLSGASRGPEHPDAHGHHADGFDAELRAVLAAVHAAGEEIMRFFRTDQEVRMKGHDQPVTQADLSANAILEERLLGTFPDYGWLSEETVDRPDRLDRDRVWIVDPIDGTRSFIAGYREFGISVGLVERGRPVVGVVYNPARDDLFWAVRGHGAFRQRHWDGAPPTTGQRLEISDPDVGVRTSIIASRSELRRGELEPFAADYEIRTMGSTAYKLVCVAAAVGHLFISRGPKSEWDLAGGHVVVEESGGRVTDLRGQPVRYNGADPYVHGVLAGPPAAHEALLARSAALAAPRLRGGVVHEDE